MTDLPLSDPEVPDADRIEQHTPVGGGLAGPDEGPGRLGDGLDDSGDGGTLTDTEADVADLLEQRAELAGDDDYPHAGDQPE